MIAGTASRLIRHMEGKVEHLEHMRCNGVVGGQRHAADLIVFDPVNNSGPQRLGGFWPGNSPIVLENRPQNGGANSSRKRLLRQADRVYPKGLSFISHQFVSIRFGLTAPDVAHPARDLLPATPDVAIPRGAA